MSCEIVKQKLIPVIEVNRFAILYNGLTFLFTCKPYFYKLDQIIIDEFISNEQYIEF